MCAQAQRQSPPQQKLHLRDLLRYNLQTVRAYLLKEDFQQFWEYNSPTWAGMFLDFWCYQTMRSRIELMKKIARTLRSHRQLILNYFKASFLTKWRCALLKSMACTTLVSTVPREVWT